jgi:outer membrane protein TolC
MANPATAGASVAQPSTAVINDARANRPERKSLVFRISAAEERVAAASAGSLPALTAVAGYDMARPNLKLFPIQDKWQPSWDVGVSVRWAFFDGGRVRAETAEAAANQRATEARLRDFDSVIEVEIRQRMADLNSAGASIAAAAAGVRAAMEARRVLAERFSAGVATNTDVLLAQTALLQAELDLTRARANAALAGARLDRALGR